MKNLFLSTLFFLIGFSSLAQSGMNYQAVVRDNSGTVLVNQNVNIEFRIIETSTFGATIYAETQNLNTNAFGNLTAIIGQGDSLLGDFENIKWGSDNFYLNVIVNGTDMGTTPLISVPHAQYADKGKNEFSVDSTIILGGEAPFIIKTGEDGRLYFQKNNNINSARLIIGNVPRSVSRPNSGIRKDLLPFAYGHIFGNTGDFHTHKSTSNLTTSERTGTGEYEITISGLYWQSQIFCSANLSGYYDSPGTVRAYKYDDKVIVKTYDMNCNLSDRSFNFIVYKP